MNYAESTTDATPLSDEHAEMLATKWWPGTPFRQQGKYRNVFASPFP